jgi:3-oxoadipate enol-lactonase
VAQTFTLQHPERVASLALVTTMGRAMRDLYEARAEAAEREGMAAQVASSLLRWLTPEVVAENPWYVRYARERIIRAQVPNWAAAWRALAAFDRLDELAKIKTPTHIIGGEKDLATPVEEFSRPIAERMPQARLSTIPGAPHLAPLVTPHEMSTLLTQI